MMSRTLTLLLAAGAVTAVHHFKDINSLDDFNSLGFWEDGKKPEQGEDRYGWEG